MAGRKPTPNAVKKLKGTAQPARMREEPTFDLITKAPPAPKHFNKFAKREFRCVCDQLIRNGILNAANLTIVVMYANEIGKYHEAETLLSETGRLDIAKDADGNILKISRLPLDKMASEYLSNAKQLAIELGITPSSAGRVKMEKKKATNPLMAFLNGEDDED